MEARYPAVAGMFYPESREALSSQLDLLIQPGFDKKKVLGIVSPHAGYIYSGGVAGSVYSTIRIPQKVILLGPNHTGLGARASVMSKGSWELPNGAVEIDSSLAETIIESSRVLRSDDTAHLREHSIEVQVPFLLHERADIEIVPITLMQLDFGLCRDVGEAVADAVIAAKSDALIVASSDMTHYESQKSAEIKDGKAIEKILDLDPEGLLDIVINNNISMCGVIPVTIMLIAAKRLGAKKASLIKYATSGDVSGDYDQVVGYAGLTVE